MSPDPSRRQFLRGAAGTAATGLVGAAGCLEDPYSTADTDPTERTPIPTDDRDPTEQTIPDGVTQFRRSLEGWGYFPEEQVPDAVEQDWRIDHLNTGDHSAAKASATPLPDGGVVLPGDSGYVIALEPDGEVRWRGETDMDGRGVHGTAAIADGRVYIGAYDGALYAFDVESGDRLWRTKLGGSIGSSPRYHDGLVFMAVEYPDPEGSMFAVEASSGDVAWEDPESRPTDHPHSTPAVDLASGYMAVGSNDGSLYGWEYPSLEYAWSFETNPSNWTDGDIKGPVATYDGAAFFGSWDERIYRVNLEDGTEDWSVDTGGLVMSGPAIDPSLNVVFCGSHDGHLYAIDADGGDVHWRFETGDLITGCPTVCADRIVVGSKDRTLYAVDKRQGFEVWSVDHEGVVTSTPLVHDGAIYYAERAPDPNDGETDGGGYKLVAAES